MKALTYRQHRLESGLPLEAMAAAFKTLGKQDPTATTDTVMGDLLLYWHPNMGTGQAIVEDETGHTRTLTMPHRSRGTRSKPEAVLIPSPCVLRLIPDEGEGLTVQVASSGAFTVVDGAEATPAEVLPDEPGQTLLQAKARAWLRDGRVGSSSYALCVGLTGVKDPQRDEPVDTDIPWDAGDFKRCEAFFKAVPDARPLLPQMIHQGRYWAELVPVWEELEGLASTGSWTSVRDVIDRAVGQVKAQDVSQMRSKP